MALQNYDNIKKRKPLARFTKYLTIYQKIIVSLIVRYQLSTIVAYGVLRFLLGISQANLRTLSQTI